jgi:uncharacterized membrane protein
MTIDPAIPVVSPPVGVKRIGTADLHWALAEGWADFRERRGDILVLALLYPLMGVITAAIFLHDALTPLFFPLVAGLSILGPAAATGFYELARRREAGLSSNWNHFLDPLNGRSRWPLALLTGGLLALFTVWLLFAWAIYSATLGSQPITGLGDFIRRLFSTPQGWALIVLGNLAGFVLAAITLVCSLVAFPMVVDRPVDAFTAVETSVQAARLNPSAVATWGLWIAGLLVLGAIPAFLGLAVVLPVVGYATWHLYTRLVQR